MASAKDLKKQIQSISNTKKITRTMEMVSAAKAKQTQGRVEANTPYAEKMNELMDGLGGASAIDHPLLKTPEGVKRNALLVISANRGLCGGYNTNVLVRSEKWVAAQKEQGRETDIYMIGKKGIARAKFQKTSLHAQYTEFDDRPSFEQARELAEGFMTRFLKGEVDQVWVLSTRYFTAAVQRPELTQLLPIQPSESEDEGDGAAAGEFIFEPDPRSILESLLPFSVNQLMYRLLIEAACSEQLARRMAMKLATDNAEELTKTYTRKYNRQRQAGITQQIMEIVGGAEALE
ncbi:MAG: ATP synthase F1 subunit gamma [Planctomycetota bacterium]